MRGSRNFFSFRTYGMRRQTGEYVQVQTGPDGFDAFVPKPLPPDPPLATDASIEDLRDRANRALGRLDGISDVLPDSRLFLYQYVRKEALLSSQIEGTQSSFSDLLLYEQDETPGVPMNDVREVSNYVAAMTHGLNRLKEGYPLSLYLLREMHGILLAKGRGAEKSPGTFRHNQVYVKGGSGRPPFIPPPAYLLAECLNDFEPFLQGKPGQMPVLVRAALAHVQFETIHPFFDGNGRIGRLLITLMLCAEQVLTQPSLYLSLYFKRNREDYYDRLQAVRSDGDWEGWLKFFLEGVFETSQQAVRTAQRVLELFDTDRKKLTAAVGGRKAGSTLRVHEYLQRHPITSVPDAARELDLSQPTVRTCITSMRDQGTVREISGRERRRLYVYDAYVSLLAEGTEPFSR